MKHIHIILALVCSMQLLNAKNAVAPEATGSIQHVHSATEFDKAVKGGKHKIVVKVATEWCGACKSYKPTFNSVAEKFQSQATFIVVDADKAPEIAQRFGVTAYPTTIIIQKEVGGMGADELENKITGRASHHKVTTVAPEEEAPAKNKKRKTSY